MATKFSDFTGQAATGTSFVVGFDGTTNTKYTQDQLTNFVLDGTLSAARTLKLNGNNLTINYGTGSVFPSLDMGKVVLYPNGENNNNPPTTIKTSGNIYFTYGAPYYQGLVWTSFNTSQKAWYTSMYGGGGWSHYQGYSVIGPNFSNITSGGALTAKLGIIGLHNDNSSYAFRVQNSDSDELMQVRNDGAIAIGKGATLPVGNTSTVIGTGASAGGNGTGIGNGATASGGGATVLGSYSSAAGSYSVAIGYDTDVSAVSSSIAIGANANVGAANSINIDASGNNSSSNNDAGTLKVHLTSNTTPSFQVDAANGMTPPTFSSNPSSPSAGNVIYNTSDNKLKFYNGSAWADAAGGDSIYTANGSINEDRTVTISDDGNSSYDVTLASTPTRNYKSGNLIIQETSNPLVHTNSGNDYGAKLILKSNIGNATYETTAQLVALGTTSGAETRLLTNRQFYVKNTTTNYNGVVAKFGNVTSPTNRNTTHVFYTQGQSGGYAHIAQGQMGTGRIFLHGYGFSNIYGMMLKASRSSYLIIGPQTSSTDGDETLRVTSSGLSVGVGGANTARLHVKGSGLTNGTTAFLVEDSSGNDIIKALDDQTVRLGYNANQITTESGSGGVVKLNNVSGDPLFSTSIVSGSTGKINVYGGYYRTFEYAASQGLVFHNEAGFHVSQDDSSMLTCISSTKGFLPPRMTTTQRNAINSGTFTTGLTLYNTTTNKLQFYNGSAWTDAGGGGDNIYTADGTLTGNRNVDLATYNLGFTNGQVGIGTSSPLYTLDTKGTVADNWLARVQNESGTGYGLQVKVDSNSSGKVTFATKNSVGYTMTVHNNGNVAIGKNNLTGPSARLQIKGSGTTNASTALLVEDSAGADMLSVRDDGAIAIGKGANSTLPSQVAIGQTADASGSFDIAIGYAADANGGGSVAIGRSTSTSANGIAIGFANSAGANGISMGQSSIATGSGVAIGAGALAPTQSIGLGAYAKGTGANSITLNANGSDVTPSTAKAFGVYMSDASTPDFRILHDGNSYITGTGNFGVGVTNPTHRIQTPTSIGITGDSTNNGKLFLYCSAGTAHYVSIEGPDHLGGSQASYNIKLPDAAPAANQVLQSDSSGNLSWVNPRDLNFSGLPTSDPGVSGRLWNNEGVINVSE